MSNLKRLISREIRAQAINRRIRGKILTPPAPLNFDFTGAQDLTFVCDVDVGGEQPLRNVVVKINGPKARFYAQPGSPVYLDTDASGRFQVVAPADRAPEQGTLQTLDEDAESFTPAGNVGLSLVREAYDWYAGDGPETLFDPSQDADTILWLRTWDRLHGLPSNITPASDADGAEVLQIAAKSPSTINAVIGTTAPLYRRFDSGTLNTLSSADFDGSTDGMLLSSNVVESTPGEISIFILCQKDAVGAGDDVLLELRNWRIFSRQTAGDTWAFDNGGAVQDSGQTIGTSYVLIELVATSFGDVDLYQDGGFLGNFAPAASGLLLPNSSLGYSAAAAGGSHDGRVLEVLVLDRTVSGADRVNIEAYFDRLANEAYTRWADGINGYPKLSVYDSEGNPI